MIEITVGVIVVVGVAAFLIGLTKAGLGGGLGPAITAVMVLALPVEIALAIQLPMLIIGDFFSVGAFWKQWSRIHLLRLAAGAVPGVLIGTFLITNIDATAIQRIIGGVGLTFVVYRLLQSRLASISGVKATAPLGAAGGALGGIASTVAHAGAPPVSAYLLIARVTPVEYAATHILLFAGINLLKVPAYLAAGLSYPSLQLRLAPLVIFIPLGVLVGRWMVTRIRQVVFDRLILGVLTVTGFYLLFL